MIIVLLCSNGNNNNNNTILFLIIPSLKDKKECDSHHIFRFFLFPLPSKNFNYFFNISKICTKHIFELIIIFGSEKSKPYVVG